MIRTRTAFAMAAVTLLAATQAQAHAKLLGANPPVNSTVAAPRQIVLKFSERLQPRFSGFDVSKGGARVPMKASIGKDRLSMVGTPASPLAPGAYRIAWHAVTADTHRMQGAYTFVVR
ncbi:MAG TPA: copper homeostasis periplasmic binding protein CopC [Phenylobacterium sp.]|nr:copper homeostasis periplasmic binding protein CopC [Phenylobacterium sp.]